VIKLINKILSKFNAALIKTMPHAEFKLKQKWYQSFNFKYIIDVGANAGQFAISVTKAFPDATVYAFEPLPETFNDLNNLFKDNHKVLPINKGIGDKNTKEKFYINNFSPVSSLLEMTNKHKMLFPQSKNTQTLINVEIETLDTFFLDKTIEKALLKIDVQGYEDKVLMGANETLKKVDLIIVETSFKVLYKQQALFDDIYQILKQKDFIFYGVFNELVAGDIDEPIQIDAIFIKK